MSAGKLTRTSVANARKRAQKAELLQKIASLREKEMREGDLVKREQYRAERIGLQYRAQQMRTRRNKKQ
jgi:hypothetical protein